MRLQCEAAPEEWAQQILSLLRNRDKAILDVELKPGRDLASHYLSHLLIAGASSVIPAFF